MTRHAFAPAQVVEWLDIPTVCRILQVPALEVHALIAGGRLQARHVQGEIRVSSTSLDAYSESLPAPIAAPEPEVFVKVHGRAYREVVTASGTKLIPV